MDAVDIAQDYIERSTEAAVRNITSQPKTRHTGACHYCGDRVQSPKLYCDGDCAAGHDEMLRARRRAGM